MFKRPLPGVSEIKKQCMNTTVYQSHQSNTTSWPNNTPVTELLGFPKFPISGIFSFGMVLNGKAELAGKVARAAKIRYEQVELCVILGALIAAGTLSYQLYSSMVDGWQLHAHTRWHVLFLSGSLLVLSVIACVYVCQHLQTVRLHFSYPSPTVKSANSELRLVVSSSDRPPSYEAVAPVYLSIPPPPYSEVINV